MNYLNVEIGDVLDLQFLVAGACKKQLEIHLTYLRKYAFTNEM